MGEGKRERILGFDLVRMLSIAAAITFHYQVSVWDDYRDVYKTVLPQEPIFWNGIQNFLKYFSFSGFSILFLTIFLMGINAKRETINWPVILLLPFGWVIFCWLTEDPFFLYWDIYTLISVGLLMIQSLFRWTKIRPIYFLIFGIGIMNIPFWEYDFFYRMPLVWQMVFVGNCTRDFLSWPLLPWVGLMFMAYSAGQMVKDHLWNPDKKFVGIPWKKYEYPIWAVILGGSIPFWGAYYQTTMPEYDCLIYRYPLHEFWAHLFGIIFLMRLSLIKPINDYLAKKVSWVANLEMNRNFGFFYFYSFLSCYAFEFLFGDHMRATPILFTISIFVFWIFTEGTARIWLRYLPRRGARV